jgi:hypothetical protein
MTSLQGPTMQAILQNSDMAAKDYNLPQIYEDKKVAYEIARNMSN